MTTSSPSAAGRIAVLGEALIDVFPDREVIGGAPFNVARNLAALGASPLMITPVGTDRFGDDMADEYARFGMDTAGLQRDPARPTGLVTVHMTGASHTFEIGGDAAWDAIDAEAAVAAVKAAAPAVVYFGTLAQRDPTSRAAIRAAVAATGALPFLDLNLRDGPDNQTLAAESLTLARMVKVNDDELDRLIGWFIRPGEPALAFGLPAQRDATWALMRRFGVDRLVVTRGADGWASFDAPSQTVLEGGSPPVSVVDTVGAGDAFASVLLMGVVEGWPLEDTLPRAAAFATRVCALKGAVDIESGIYAQARAAWAAER